MSATVARPLPYATGSHVSIPSAECDAGARLSVAVLGYLLALIGTLALMPFEFRIPASYDLAWDATWRDAALAAALFLPVGFLARRATRPRHDRFALSAMSLATVASVGIETLQLYTPHAHVSPWDVLAHVGGAACGVALFETVARRSSDEVTSDVLLLQLPLMGLLYLLVPLLWVSSLAAQGEPARLALTLLVGLTGASILGSVARAMAPMTIERAWWSVGAAAATWVAVGIAPAARLDPSLAAGTILVVAAYAGWRGRLNAPAFHERRFEVPALRAAAPFLALFLVGSAIWPARGFRTHPLWHLGFPTADGGLALVLPVVEALVGATVLGYVIAEFNGRAELGFRRTWPRVLRWALLILVGGECTRSLLAYEGASGVRLLLGFVASIYGAGLYHLQREHVKVVARRRREAAAARAARVTSVDGSAVAARAARFPRAR
ncbi:MAG: VanZ family protein [Gemmatimonadaceae bacterium]|jgi:VanZ family protein|nr:VanZ family protein [Gemmatimonadaceae bacterium]